MVQGAAREVEPVALAWADRISHAATGPADPAFLPVARILQVPRQVLPVQAGESPAGRVLAVWVNRGAIFAGQGRGATAPAVQAIVAKMPAEKVPEIPDRAAPTRAAPVREGPVQEVPVHADRVHGGPVHGAPARKGLAAALTVPRVAAKAGSKLLPSGEDAAIPAASSRIHHGKFLADS